MDGSGGRKRGSGGIATRKSRVQTKVHKAGDAGAVPPPVREPNDARHQTAPATHRGSRFHRCRCCRCLSTEYRFVSMYNLGALPLVLFHHVPPSRRTHMQAGENYLDYCTKNVTFVGQRAPGGVRVPVSFSSCDHVLVGTSVLKAQNCRTARAARTSFDFSSLDLLSLYISCK